MNKIPAKKAPIKGGIPWTQKYLNSPPLNITSTKDPMIVTAGLRPAPAHNLRQTNKLAGINVYTYRVFLANVVDFVVTTNIDSTKANVPISYEKKSATIYLTPL